MQDALAALAKWSTLWQLEISINKCCILNIGKIPCEIVSNYCINNVALPVVRSCHDLGVNISSDLSFHAHINDIVLKAQQRANIILRSFICRDINVLLRAFIVYVRPLLECNTVIWSPSCKRDINRIDSVQWFYQKIIWTA